MNQRTPKTDSWSPFGDADTSTERPPEHRPEGLPESWTIIDGGHDIDMDAVASEAVDAGGFDAAADEAIAAARMDAVSEAAAPEAAPAVEAPAEAVPGAAETTVQEPAKAVPAADSAVRTPHSSESTTESETPAETAPEVPETPQSAPAWRNLLAALNPGGVLYAQQASIAEVMQYARDADYSDNPVIRGLEIGWNRIIAVPSVFTLYWVAAVLKRLWRAVGATVLAAAWVIAVHTSPLDPATVWTWALIGYWTLSATLVPAIATTPKP